MNHDQGDLPGTHVGGALAHVLSSLNIPELSVQDSVLAEAQRVLTERGYTEVKVSGLREGKLKLCCDPFSATLLRLDAYQLKAALEAALPGAVTEVLVTCS
jgi:hypothetical protein